VKKTMGTTDQSTSSSKKSAPAVGITVDNLLEEQTPASDFDLVLLDGKDDDIERCNYWVMSYQKGNLHPLDLVKREQVATILSDAISTGIEESGEMLVADSHNEGRFFYLVELPEDDFRKKAVWASSIVNMIKSWAQPSVGFSLSLKDIEQPQIEDMFAQIFRSLQTQKTGPMTIYVVARDINPNTLLNLSLRLKSELEGDSILVNVRH
jgi:hypothetical protein